MPLQCKHDKTVRVNPPRGLLHRGLRRLRPLEHRRRRTGGGEGSNIGRSIVVPSGPTTVTPASLIAVTSIRPEPQPLLRRRSLSRRGEYRHLARAGNDDTAQPRQAADAARAGGRRPAIRTEQRPRQDRAPAARPAGHRPPPRRWPPPAAMIGPAARAPASASPPAGDFKPDHAAQAPAAARPDRRVSRSRSCARPRFGRPEAVQHHGRLYRQARRVRHHDRAVKAHVADENAAGARSTACINPTSTGQGAFRLIRSETLCQCSAASPPAASPPPSGSPRHRLPFSAPTPVTPPRQAHPSRPAAWRLPPRRHRRDVSPRPPGSPAGSPPIPASAPAAPASAPAPPADRRTRTRAGATAPARSVPAPKPRSRRPAPVRSAARQEAGIMARHPPRWRTHPRWHPRSG